MSALDSLEGFYSSLFLSHSVTINLVLVHGGKIEYLLFPSILPSFLLLLCPKPYIPRHSLAYNRSGKKRHLILFTLEQ